eukprot:1889977-Prymnesium_polylepis.1
MRLVKLISQSGRSGSGTTLSVAPPSVAWQSHAGGAPAARQSCSPTDGRGGAPVAGEGEGDDGGLRVDAADVAFADEEACAAVRRPADADIALTGAEAAEWARACKAHVGKAAWLLVVHGGPGGGHLRMRDEQLDVLSRYLFWPAYAVALACIRGSQ